MNSEEIAGEWIRMSITNDTAAVRTILTMMLRSREITVNYMTPLGLHHQMYAGHHYGPGPWVKRGRADQTSVYFSRADSIGLGFDRTSSGSKAVEQYFSPVRELYNDINSCPENLLLWFHHVPWDYRVHSGRTMWDELCFRYDDGVKSVKWLQDEWNSVKHTLDTDRFEFVSLLLKKQERDAKIWRDACILYFQTFSKRPIPAGVSKPENNLDYYINYRYTDIPGISRR